MNLDTLRNSLTPKRWKIILVGSLSLYLVCFFVHMGLAFHYVRNSSPVPNVQTGAIYQLSMNGWFVYLNESQHQLLERFWSMGLIFALVFVLARLLTLHRLD
jgi:hypothetical protein